MLVRMLRIRLFGCVSYVVDGADEIRLTDLRFPRVLAYLAVHSNTHPTKEAVRNAVWGRGCAEDNLRRAMRELRDQHPQLASHIQEQGRTIGFEPAGSLDVDVLRFAGLKQAERYDEALREVRGGFMADVPNNLSEWVDTERRRWNGQAARVCELIAARDWHLGRHESSVELARHRERLRPLELPATIALAAYLAASGEANEALAKLTTFRARHGALGEQEGRHLDAAIARLRSGALLRLPEVPVLTNGASGSRETASRQPDPQMVREVRAHSEGSPARRPAQRDGRKRVCSRADNALRDEYRLAGWVAGFSNRREFYFAWCDKAARELMRLTDGAEPKTESLVWTLVAALSEDDSFASHVAERGGVFLTDDRNWHKLYRAAAATILEEYLADTQKGTWP